MKLILPIILGLLFVGHSFSQSRTTIFHIPENQSEIIKLNKIVKEVIYNYILNKNNIKDSALFTTYYYDTLGNVIEEKMEKTKIYGETVRKYSYSYDPAGKLIKKIVDMPGWKMVSIYEYEYDSAGNEITMYDYNKDTTTLRLEQKTYNKNNQVTELLTKINHADPYVSKRYYYNQTNELSKEIAFNRKGEILYTYFYDYDKSLNKKTVYLENAESKKRIAEYFYNNEKQIVKVNSIFKSHTVITRESIEYENLNKVEENIYNEDGTLFETAIYINGKKSQLNRHYYFTQL